jgi:hypothetical protein
MILWGYKSNNRNRKKNNRKNKLKNKRKKSKIKDHQYHLHKVNKQGIIFFIYYSKAKLIEQHIKLKNQLKELAIKMD